MTRQTPEKTPSLVGISGPAKDTIVHIDGLTRLGRDAGNTVPLDDETVSRLHTEVYIRDGQVAARDLGSTNGTYVNGARLPKAGERVLKHRDVLKIGTSRFVYLEREEPVINPPSAASHPGRERKTTTVRVGPFDDLVARSDRSVAAALVGFGNEINQIRNIQDMLERTLEAVFDTIPALRAAIQLREGSEIYQEMTSGSSEPFDIDPFIRRQALDGNIPVLSNDGDSILCVPVAAGTSPLGMIYVQHSDPAALHGGHLEMLCGLAGFAAPVIENLLEREWLIAQAKTRLLESVHIPGDAIVGESAPMKEVYLTIQKVAATDASVLILGENGTGKELAALAIHRNSRRAGKPFIVVNCGAIPEGLKQSELFGHEKGSFTGATSQRKGKLEVANGGTLFLDEIGELPLDVQVLLLRFLQQHEIQRIGSNVVLHSDARLIAATNRNLEQMVRQGTFREDLYYRLRVVPLRMPSLIDRLEDIPLLTAYFIRVHAARMGKQVLGVSREAHLLLMSHRWNGNVRELENVIIGALVFAEGDYIGVEDLQRILEAPLTFERKIDDTLESFVERAERWFIQSTLDDTAGNVADAAKRLNLNRTSLYRKLETLNIRHDQN